MAEEIAGEDYLDSLGLLGEVEPPAVAVLENAREMLWSVVASQMLELDPVADAVPVAVIVGVIVVLPAKEV